MPPTRRPILVVLAVFLALSWAAPAALAHGKGGNFAAWVKGVRKQAREQGIPKKILDSAFRGLKPDPRVIKLDRRQPEFTMTFARYIGLVVTDKQVANGRRNFTKYRKLLDEVSAQYGVAPEIIVALWGVESKFGKHMGNFDVIRSLATLAHDGRRSAYFRKELMAALRILHEGHIGRREFRGSWAGAMGQSQFMPSSFRAYAVDHNGDGRIDIWGTRADVFASAANYLARNGWTRGQRWGRPVTLPPGFKTSLAGRATKKQISEWRKLGVAAKTGGGDPLASVILPDGAGGPAYFGYHNFNVIRRWNPSDFFVLAVGTLADRIARE